MGSSKRSSKKQKKTEDNSGSDSDFHNDDKWPENDYHSGRRDDGSDDDDDDGGDSSGGEYGYDDLEDLDDGEQENNDAEKNSEMAKLEKEVKEYKDQHVEQDTLKSLKRRKDEELLVGRAVKNQKALWDKALEIRFLLQKAYSSSNRLPQEPIRTSFCSLSDGVSEAYSELITSSEQTLDSIHKLQEALLEKNPTIIQSSVGLGQHTEQLESSGNSDGTGDELWLRIFAMHSRMAPYRNKSIDKWQRKTEVTTGAASMKGKLHAFNQTISQQVAGYMKDPSKMLKGMLQNKAVVAPFGTVLDSGGPNTEVISMDGGDPELLDDSDFYQQLLKEFFETIDPNSSETAFYAVKRLQAKKRKIVDRRASKSRKIRYNVHEKIVNFMAPEPMKIHELEKVKFIFDDLFGLKKQSAEA